MSIIFLVLFYFLEIFFTFYPETNGVNDTYSSQIWRYYYWKLNKEGFRDIEFETMADNDKPSIVFAGDSYTEGHGIKNPDDRVSNIIRKKLTGYNVYNIGKCGMGIDEEMNLIKNIPIRPKIIVLQICANDWDYLQNNLQSKNVNPTLLLAEINGLSISEYSITFNYLKSKMKNIIEKMNENTDITAEQSNQIFELYNIKEPQRIKSRNVQSIFTYCEENTKLPEDTIQNRVLNAFKVSFPSIQVMMDSTRFSNYINKLLQINTFCIQRNIKFTVVPYPEFDDFSMNITAKHINKYLCGLINKQGITCHDIVPALKKANLNSYTVNSNDNHINSEASKIVADTLITSIK